MSALADLQRDLQHHVLDGDTSIFDAVNETATVPAATRLGVYFGAYRYRLVEALANNMPRLHQLLGDGAFAQLARDYIAANPSHFTSVRWFGDRLAHSLTQT